MKKLWIVQRYYHPGAGGASRRIQELAQGMQTRFNWAVTIITCATPSAPISGMYDNIRVKVAHCDPLTLKGRWQLIWQISSWLHSTPVKPQAIHFNAPIVEYAPLITFCRKWGIRTVMQLTLEGQDDPFSLSQGRKYPRFLAKRLLAALSRADAILCMSPSLQALCIQYGWDETRIRWSPHAKDPNFFRPVIDQTERQKIRDSFGLPRETLLAGFLGNLSPRKGFGELMEAWAAADFTATEAHLALAGAYDSNAEWVDSQLSIVDRNTVTYLGLLDRNRVASFLRCVDIFVLPSKREGMAGALVEAILSGAFPITTSLPGVNDLLIADRQTGILITPESVNELTDALRTVTQSEELRHSLTGGRESILPYFDPERVYAAYDKLYYEGLFQFADPRLLAAAAINKKIAPVDTR